MRFEGKALLDSAIGFTKLLCNVAIWGVGVAACVALGGALGGVAGFAVGTAATGILSYAMYQFAQLNWESFTSNGNKFISGLTHKSYAPRTHQKTADRTEDRPATAHGVEQHPVYTFAPDAEMALARWSAQNNSKSKGQQNANRDKSESKPSLLQRLKDLMPKKEEENDPLKQVGNYNKDVGHYNKDDKVKYNQTESTRHKADPEVVLPDDVKQSSKSKTKANPMAQTAQKPAGKYTYQENPIIIEHTINSGR